MLVLDGFRKFNPEYAHPKSGLVLEPAKKCFGRIVLGDAERVQYKKGE